MPHFNEYDPAAFGWNKPVTFAPYSYGGVSIPPGINPAAGLAALFTFMLDALVPHIPGGLVPGWCWGGTTSDKVPTSFHLFGTAIDLNAPVNPMTSSPHSFGGQHVLPANTGDIIRPFGFEWGGNWTDTQDYMHLECALAPFEVIVLAATLKTATAPATPTDTGEFTMDQEATAALNAIKAQLNAQAKVIAHIAQFIDGIPPRRNGQANRMVDLMAHEGMKPVL